MAILQLPIHESIQGIVMNMLVIPPPSAVIDILITTSLPLRCVTTADHLPRHGKPATRTPRNLLAVPATKSIGELRLHHTETTVLLTTPTTSRFLRLLEMRRTLLDPTVV